MKRKIMAWLMVLILVWTLVPVNAVQVDAAKKVVKVKKIKFDKKKYTISKGTKLKLQPIFTPKKTTQKN